MNRLATKMPLLAAVVVAGAVLASNVVNLPAQSAAPAGQRVFYASHSLMWDMPPVLAEEAAAYGIMGHTIAGHQRIGVSRASQHWTCRTRRTRPSRRCERAMWTSS
jgi:hypothetical protein